MIFNCCSTNGGGGGGRVNTKDNWLEVCPWLETDKNHAFRACLHGGGGPQVGYVTCLGGVTRLSI